MMGTVRWLCLVTFALLSGCITRLVTVQSHPSGALVYLNGEEVGRTPVNREFQWYGTYDVVLRKEGYETMKTSAAVSAPLWQWIPFDFFTDMLPVTDEHVIWFDLKPQPPADPAKVLSSGEQLRGLLQSSEHTTLRRPSTRPTTSSTRKEIKH